MSRVKYNKDGWILGKCVKCGRKHYIEPHGTTAQCACQPGGHVISQWLSENGYTKHEPIFFGT